MTEYEAFYNAGVTLLHVGDLSRAEVVLRRALELRAGDASAEWALGHALLSAGRYAEGWPYLRARKVLQPDNCKTPTNVFPEWNGESISGKRLLVMSEQGRGDQIMFARFAQTLRDRGATVTLVAWRDIAPLLGHLAEWVTPIEAGARGVGIPEQDYWTHYFSLPEHLGITLQNLPSSPYIPAPAGGAECDRYAGKVGLFWQTRDPHRNLPEPLVHRLLARGLVSLDPADTGARDFSETAAIIGRLKLVVTIDTAVAHLAGAMGKPVWILLPHRKVDWRWMRDRTDSPWYPSARLFRQGPDGWPAVLAEVEAALP